MHTPDSNAPSDDTITPAPTLLALTWGLQPPPTARIAWGARAIYKLDNREEKFFANGKRRKTPKSVTVASIDLPYDRQAVSAVEGATEDERRALGDWINKFGIPMLRAECVKQYLTGDSADSIEVESKPNPSGFKLKASPCESFGYLYIVAWRNQ